MPPTIAADRVLPGTHPVASNRVTLSEPGVRTPTAVLGGQVRVIGLDEDRNPSMWSWTTLMDGVIWLGVILSIPVAILVVGTPVALALALLLRLVRAALRVF